MEDLRERGYQPESKFAMYFLDTQVTRPDCFFLAVRTAGDPLQQGTVLFISGV